MLLGRKIFLDSAVNKRLKNDFVVVAQVLNDPTDSQPESNLKWLTNGEAIASPYYVVLNTSGHLLHSWAPPNNISETTPEEFYEFLTSSLIRFEALKTGFPQSKTEHDIYTLDWTDKLTEGLTKAKSSSKPIFVNFTAYNDKNCRLVERNILNKKEVFKLLKDDFEIVWQYTDSPDTTEPVDNLVKLAGVRHVPLLMVLDTDGKEIARLVPPNNLATLTVAEFADFLRKAKLKFAER